MPQKASESSETSESKSYIWGRRLRLYTCSHSLKCLKIESISRNKKAQYQKIENLCYSTAEYTDKVKRSKRCHHLSMTFEF